MGTVPIPVIRVVRIGTCEWSEKRVSDKNVERKTEVLVDTYISHRY